MAIKTYGTLVYNGSEWVISEARPHVCMKLKSIFPKIAKNAIPPYKFAHTPEICRDLKWFISRYPLELFSELEGNLLQNGVEEYDRTVAKMEEVLLPHYTPKEIILNTGEKARDYQLRAAELHQRTKRLLLGDDVGLGKTLSGILTFFTPNTLPAIVVVQTHLTRQWKAQIERFTNLRVHTIKGTKPYDLPPADVYVTKYSCLSGWTNIFATGFFKSAVLDEAQEVRISGSQKYGSAQILSNHVEYCLGMTATPVYNYGDEIFNVLDLIKPGCLGSTEEFWREWTTRRGTHNIVLDPDALGTYLRDNYLFLRRSRKEVGHELPPINTIIHTVGYDEVEVKKAETLARELAMRVISGVFTERGQAARELDMLVRQKTGVSKAREVAEYVKILLENKEPVVLAGWHREVYDIWAESLSQYNPVFYTGTESEAQKQKAKDSFVNKETDLFIISLRSGIGLDGLQSRCKTVVIGELDWSPQVHTQLIGRVDRPGQQEQVTVIYTVSEYGSDPVIMDVLGLKASQAHSIANPLTAPVQTISDDSRIKMLAWKFLTKSS